MFVPLHEAYFVQSSTCLAERHGCQTVLLQALLFV